jgi:hypothetical protein
MNATDALTLSPMDWFMFGFTAIAIVGILLDARIDNKLREEPTMTEIPDDGPGIVYRCPKCNSDAVYFDARAAMNDPDDVILFDEKVCNACGERFTEAKECEE